MACGVDETLMMHRGFSIPLLAAIALLTILAGNADADRLVLISQTVGQYDYGIQLDPNHGLTIAAGDQITLMGLAGVTGASVLPNLSFAYSIGITTPTSVTVADAIPFVLDPLAVSHTISAVRVMSSASTTGLVNYQVQTASEGTLSGTVPGPVSDVPEPGELPAVSVAVAALAALQRKCRVAQGTLAECDHFGIPLT